MAECVVQRSTPRRIAFGGMAAALGTLMVWGVHDTTLALMGRENAMEFDRAESLFGVGFMFVASIWLSTISGLYLHRMLSRHPFAVIRDEGVECWRLHRRVRMPWPDAPALYDNRGELQLLDMSADPTRSRWATALKLPIGGEAVKLRDASCVQSLDDVAAAVRAHCPRDVVWL